MPGYVMHLVESRLILERLGKTEDTDWSKAFLLGSLLPDTRLKEEKAISHFWNEKCLKDIAKAPDLELFLKKYGNRLDEPLIFGYYLHLYLDVCYVRDYWPGNLAFKNSRGEAETEKAAIAYVVIRKDGKKVSLEDFFTREYYYGDYTLSNGWFIHRYHISPPEYAPIGSAGMEEVRLEDVKPLLEELDWLCRLSDEKDSEGMRVFDIGSLDRFLHETADRFMEEISGKDILSLGGEKHIINCDTMK